MTDKMKVKEDSVRVDKPTSPTSPTHITSKHQPKRKTKSCLKISPVVSFDDVISTILGEEKKAMLLNTNRIMGKTNLLSTCTTHHDSSWLMHSIKKAITASTKVMIPQKFRFGDGRDAVEHNTKISKRCKYDVEQSLRKEKGTIVESGFEFRHSSLLSLIF